MYNVALSKADRNLTAKALLGYSKFDKTLVLGVVFCLELLALFITATDADAEEFTQEEAVLVIEAIDYVAPRLDGEFDADADQLRDIKMRLIEAAGRTRATLYLPPARGAMVS
jgi:hypothetical protein